MAWMRSSRVSGCCVTALPDPTREKEPGAIHRQVSQSIHVLSTKNWPFTFPCLGSLAAWKRAVTRRALIGRSAALEQLVRIEYDLIPSNTLFSAIVPVK